MKTRKRWTPKATAHPYQDGAIVSYHERLELLGPRGFAILLRFSRGCSVCELPLRHPVHRWGSDDGGAA